MSSYIYSSFIGGAYITNKNIFLALTDDFIKQENKLEDICSKIFFKKRMLL